MKKAASPASPGLRTRAAGMSADDAVRAQLEGLRRAQSLELLKELHILTREGRINQDSRRKLKQVMHLAHFIEEMLAELPADADFTLVDHGAGKSYLGFVLYDLVCHAHGEQQGRGQVIGIETRADLVQRSRDLAQRLGFERMRFLPMAAADATQSSELPEQVEMVTALHACDTATDDAIDFALRKAARFIALVPCCQAEVAGRLRAGKALSLARTPLAELWRHPLHTREVGSQLTNVLRCLYLEAMGYQVTVTELVGWEHSLKNELILARHTGQRKRAAAERLKALLAEFGLSDLIGVRFQLLD
ncbi:MAG: hypothetical protein RIQ96_31 [Pseudomonadota bacterium]